MHALLSDPGLLLTAEPACAAELLDQAPDAHGRAVADVYRMSADMHRTLSAVQRRQVLALDAARLGRPELAAWFRSADVTGRADAEWIAGWATGVVTDHRQLRCFTRHSDSVTAVATAVVDGRTVAVSGSRDAVVHVWDLATGEHLQKLATGQSDPLSSMTPELLSVATAEVDGSAVAFMAQADGSVRVWDLKSGCSAAELVRVVECRILDGCPVLVTLAADRTLDVWDVDGGKRLGAYLSVVGIGELDGRRVAVTAPGGEPVRVRDLATGRDVGECLQVVDAFFFEERPFAVAGRQTWDLGTNRRLGRADLEELDFSRCEPLLGVSALTAVDRRVVTVTLDYQDEPEPVGELAAGYRGCEAMRGQETAVVGSRRMALAVGADQALRLWDVTPGPELHDGVRMISSHAPDERLLSLSLDADDGRDYLWELISGRRNGRFNADDTVRTGAGAISCPFALDDRTVTLHAEAGGAIAVRDAVDGSPVGFPLTGHTGRVWALDTVPAARSTLAVTAGLDRSVRVWDVASRRQQGEPLMGHTGQVRDVATAVVDGRPVAVTAGADHTVRSWDLTGAPGTGQYRTGHTAAIVAVSSAVLHGAPVVVTADADHIVHTWDVTTGQQAAGALRTEAAAMTSAVVDGRPVLVTAGPDATLHFLDLLTGQEVHRTAPGAHGRVLAVTTADVAGRAVALTAGSDGTLGVWDLTTGQPLHEPLTGHTSRVTAVTAAVLKGRPVAITGGWDKTVRVWDLTTGREVGAPFTGHTDWVTSATATTIAGKPVAVTKGRDRTIRLWDLTSMERPSSTLATDFGASGPMAVTTTEDGRPVLAVGQERTVRFFDLSTGRAAWADYLLPLPVHAIATVGGGRFAVAFGTEAVVLHEAPGPSGGPGEEPVKV